MISLGPHAGAHPLSPAMAESEIRQRGPGRDLNAARAAFDVGDVDASRQAHEAKIHSTEQHAGCVVSPMRRAPRARLLPPSPPLEPV